MKIIPTNVVVRKQFDLLFLRYCYCNFCYNYQQLQEVWAKFKHDVFLTLDARIQKIKYSQSSGSNTA